MEGKVSSWLEEGEELHRRLLPQEAKHTEDLEEGLQNVSENPWQF